MRICANTHQNHLTLFLFQVPCLVVSSQNQHSTKTTEFVRWKEAWVYHFNTEGLDLWVQISKLLSVTLVSTISPALKSFQQRPRTKP